jgi:hypothetical protein
VRWELGIAALAAGVAVGACGGSNDGTVASSPAPPPTITVTSTRVPPGPTTLTTPLKINPNPQPPPTVPTVTATTPTTTTTESKSGGAGDEQPIRVPAVYTFAGGGLSPSVVSVPAFLTVELTLVSADGHAHRATIATDHGTRTLSVAAGARSSLRLTGLKRGTYAVSADGGAKTAKLVVGVNPGP